MVEPVGCKKVLLSYGAQKVSKASQIVPESLDEPFCVVIGAIAKGSIDVDYTEESVLITQGGKLTGPFEEAWGVF